MTQLIEVSITDWEQDCCGRPFAVGDPVTWEVRRTDPAQHPDDGLVRVMESHHQVNDDDPPMTDVAGTVRQIEGLIFRSKAVAGQPGTHLELDEVVAAVDLDRVPGERSFSEYRVAVEVSDDVEIPPYIEAPSLREYRLWQAEQSRRDRERAADPVGRTLNAIADSVAARFGAAVALNRDPDRSAFSAVPRNSEACALHVARRSDDEGAIDVVTGRGRWTLPPTDESVRTVAAFVDAAASGHVEERVERTGTMRARFATVVSTTDREGFSHDELFAATPLGDTPTGYAWTVMGDGMERLERGSFAYSPWL